MVVTLGSAEFAIHRTRVGRPRDGEVRVELIAESDNVGADYGVAETCTAAGLLALFHLTRG